MAYDGEDFHCDVAIAGAAALDVVHEDERVLAYHHTRPYWTTHLVVVPKRHLASLTTLTAVARRVETAHGEAAVLMNLAGRGGVPAGRD